MRVIVTGATSFIGSHAVQALVSQGFEVCALIRPNSAGKKNLEQMIIKKELLSDCLISKSISLFIFLSTLYFPILFPFVYFITYSQYYVNIPSSFLCIFSISFC